MRCSLCWPLDSHLIEADVLSVPTRYLLTYGSSIIRIRRSSYGEAVSFLAIGYDICLAGRSHPFRSQLTLASLGRRFSRILR